MDASDADGDRPRARVAEARRNRRHLLDVATRAFASSGGDDAPVPLEAIARQAGVGIGTLYRHFPTRQALVEAVYEDQMERLRASAGDLLAERPPAIALRAWLSEFADWAATKHGMVDTLRVLMASGQLETGRMRAQLVDVVALFLAAGAETGDLRSDVPAEDVAGALAGVLAVAGGSDRREHAVRMLTLITDGLRPTGPATGRSGAHADSTSPPAR